MRVVVQRSKYATCNVDGKTTGKIDVGFLLFVGFKENDTLKEIDLLVKKIVGLRIFSDNEGKMNLNIKDVCGSILAISQFTLYGSAKHGNRPSFTDAMKYDEASKFYDIFCEKLKSNDIKVEKGVFGADMKIELLNDGPVTIILDSEEL